MHASRKILIKKKKHLEVKARGLVFPMLLHIFIIAAVESVRWITHIEYNYELTYYNKIKLNYIARVTSLRHTTYVFVLIFRRLKKYYLIIGCRYMIEAMIKLENTIDRKNKLSLYV